MRLRTDDRGVTVQIGTVLLFAVLVVLLSTYQAAVVPQQNEQVEFNHNQRVQSQLQDLRDELRRTAVTGSGGSASVALGTRYPERAFFVNPAPPSGTVTTAPPANLTLRNASATGETGDYWTGSARNFSTRGITYDPLYHVYDNPPTTVYRNGVLYNRFDGATRIVAGQQLVADNTLTLVAVNGSLSESGSASASVNVQAVSPATRTVTVENESHNVSVVVPTTLSAGKWEDLLASETNRSVGDDRYVLNVSDGPRTDSVEIVLEPGVYELRLAKVGVGRDVSGVGPHYVTDVRGDETSVAEGGTRKLVVEVRDRFNNPVTGARVNLSLVSGEPDDTLLHRGASGDAFSDLRTDSEGRVAVRFEAGEFDGSVREADVRASIVNVPDADFDPETKENATFDLQVYSVGGGDGDGGGDDGDDGDGGGSGQPPTIETFDAVDRSSCESHPVFGCNPESNDAEYDITWNVTDDDLQSVTVYVNRSGTNEAAYTGASGSRTYTASGAYGENHTIELVATDAEGNRVCEVLAGPANGNDDEVRSSC